MLKRFFKRSLIMVISNDVHDVDLQDEAMMMFGNMTMLPGDNVSCSGDDLIIRNCLKNHVL